MIRITDEIREIFKDHVADYVQDVMGKPTDGTSWNCINPNHEDHNPSMHYDGKHNQVYCFSCPDQKSYDLIRLIQVNEGMSFDEACKRALEFCCIDPNSIETDSKPRPSAPAKAQEGVPLDITDKVNEFAPKLLDDTLPGVQEAIDYLQATRGISLETVKRAEICFSPYGFNALFDSAPACKVKEAVSNECHIILPFYDGTEGRFISAQGVIKHPDKGMKYVNPKGVSLPLYNEWYLKNPPETVFICEGVFDALSIEQAGGRAIALCGSAGINRFKAMCTSFRPRTRFILMLDDDEAGYKFDKDIQEILKPLGIPFISKTASDGVSPALKGKVKDPNEALCRDPMRFPGFVQECIWLAGCVELSDISVPIQPDETEKQAAQEAVSPAPTANQADAQNTPQGIIFGEGIPLDEAYSNEFDPKWIPEPYRSYCVNAAWSMCQPVDEVVMGIMGAVSAVGSKVFKIKAAGHSTHINLMILLAAASSEKKSSCIKVGTNLIFDFESGMNADLEAIGEKFKTNISICRRRITGLEKAIADSQNRLLIGPAKRKSDKEEAQEGSKASLEDIIQTSQAEIERLKEEIARMEAVSTRREYLIDSSTVEGIRDALIDTNERLGVFSDEGGLFKAMSGLYSAGGRNADTDVIKKAWDGTACRIRRAKNRTTGFDGTYFLREPLLTICLYVQPHVVTSAFNNSEWDEEGLLARFLISKPNTDLPEYKNALGNRPDPELRKAVEERFKALAVFTDDVLFGNSVNEEPIPDEVKPFVLNLDNGAFSVFNDYYNDLETRATSHTGRPFKSVYRKHAFSTLRVIAVLHLMEHGPDAASMLVNAQTVRNGVAIGEYFLSGYFAVKGGPGGKARLAAERIIEAMGKSKTFRKRPQHTLQRDILQAARTRTWKTDDILPGFQYLEERGWLIRDEDLKAAAYYVNPGLYDIKINKNEG